MIRRYFLRILAVSPFAGLAAMQSARGETVARAAGPAGAPVLRRERVDLLMRLGRIHALRKMADAGHAELVAIADEYKGVRHGDPRDREWFERSDPIFRRTAELERRLEDLERAPIDPVALGYAEHIAHAADDVLLPGAFAQLIETRRFREDELATFSVVGVSA